MKMFFQNQSNVDSLKAAQGGVAVWVLKQFNFPDSKRRAQVRTLAIVSLRTEDARAKLQFLRLLLIACLSFITQGFGLFRHLPSRFLTVTQR